MIPGVIVSIRSNEHYRGAGDRKLRPRYKYRFCIVKRTKSTAFLRPCDEMSIRQYLTNEKLPKIKKRHPCIQGRCDTAENSFFEQPILYQQ